MLISLYDDMSSFHLPLRKSHRYTLSVEVMSGSNLVWRKIVGRTSFYRNVCIIINEHRDRKKLAPKGREINALENQVQIEMDSQDYREKLYEPLVSHGANI